MEYLCGENKTYFCLLGDYLGEEDDLPVDVDQLCDGAVHHVGFRLLGIKTMYYKCIIINMIL